MEAEAWLRGLRLREVRHIGKSLDESQADGEFVGLALFSPDAWRLVRDQYETLLANAPDRRVHEASSPATAALTDLLQTLIASGTRVDAMEVTSGWLEIHSFENYQLACRMVSR